MNETMMKPVGDFSWLGSVSDTCLGSSEYVHHCCLFYDGDAVCTVQTRKQTIAGGAGTTAWPR